jgi:alpha,alpha-trehalase
LKTEIKGKEIENEDLVNLPNWLCLTFRSPGGEWFDLTRIEIIQYRQELQMKPGILLRTIRFRDNDGRRTTVKERRLVHMAKPHLAALEMVVTPENWTGEMEFRSALDGRVVNDGVPRYRGLNNRHLDPLETQAADGDTIYLKVRTTQSKLLIAQTARTRVCKDSDNLSIHTKTIEESGYIAHEFKVNGKKGTDIHIEKVVTLFTSRDHASA